MTSRCGSYVSVFDLSRMKRSQSQLCSPDPKTHLSHLLWCDCWRNPTSMVKPQQQCMQRFLLEAKNEVRRPSNDTQIQVLVLEPDFFSFHFNKIQALKYSKVLFYQHLPNQTNAHPLRSEKMKISIWWSSNILAPWEGLVGCSQVKIGKHLSIMPKLNYIHARIRSMPQLDILPSEISYQKHDPVLRGPHF